MDTIIHIGTPKTGTTSLQAYFYDNRKTFAADGVLYPRISVSARSKNHAGLLFGLVDNPEKLPRKLRNVSAEERSEHFDTSCAEINKQIRRFKPDTLFLSSEYLFRLIPLENWNRLFEHIPKIDSGKLTFVCYARRPSRRYLSDLNQHMKASHVARPPTQIRLRTVLKSYLDTFPDAKYIVRAFETSQLENGDIIADVLTHVLPRLLPIAPDAAEAKRLNTSLSGASMEVMRRFRERFFPDKDNQFNVDSSTLFKAMLRIDEKFGLARPVLHKSVADFVDYTAIDALWARDRFGVQFEGYDYDSVSKFSRSEVLSRDWALEDLIEIDPKAVNMAFLRLGKSNWAKKFPEYQAWIAENYREDLS